MRVVESGAGNIVRLLARNEKGVGFGASRPYFKGGKLIWNCHESSGCI